MKRFGRSLVVALCIAVLGSIVSLVPQKNAAADGGAPVNIISPLPLPVTGNVNAAISGTVNVSNTAASPVPVSGIVAVGNQRTLSGGGFVPVPLEVNVTNSALPVSGSVSISGTPTVQLAAAPNLSLTGPVQVTNPTQTVSTPFGTATQPAPLLVADGRALSPYRRNCSGAFKLGQVLGTCDLGVVPNNVELVIEQVTGHLTNGSVGVLPLAVFQVALTDGAQSYDFNVFQVGADLGISQQVRLYVDGGSDVSVNVKVPPPSFGPIGLIQQYSFDICGFTVSLQ